VRTVRPGGLKDIRAYGERIQQLPDEDDSIGDMLRMHDRQVVAQVI
jgi:hypothetical protein